MSFGVSSSASASGRSGRGGRGASAAAALQPDSNAGAKTAALASAFRQSRLVGIPSLRRDGITISGPGLPASKQAHLRPSRSERPAANLKASQGRGGRAPDWAGPSGRASGRPRIVPGRCPVWVILRGEPTTRSVRRGLEADVALKRRFVCQVPKADSGSGQILHLGGLSQCTHALTTPP